MPILNSSMHRLVDADDTLTLEPASDEQPLDSRLDTLLNTVLHAFNGKSRGFGHADTPPADGTLLGQLSHYRAERIDFMTLSTEVGRSLVAALGEQLRGDGYLWVVHYRHGDTEYVAIMQLLRREGLSLDDSGNLTTQSLINTSQLPLAVRVDLTQWAREGSRNYVAYLKASKKLVEALTPWIGCEEGADAGNETRTLLKAFSDFVEQESFDDTQSRESTDAVVNYASDQAAAGEPMALDDVSRLVDETRPEAFFDYIRNSDYGLSPDVPADKKTINQFKRFTGRASGVSISFDSHLLGDSIEFNEAQDRLIIKKIPESLKTQLLDRKR
ncbi:nucleoid-associated protein [Larsenimonas suaedae]|uniref:Nucleoid-associated protein n=1 Tax=Larsenimonas suaedae TaxID=1851019 RepID=A0ABU1GVX2_9GAMM|nr:nucleoid-associated protein [Larsenimonas suaedae]MCM2971916.1 nucleoid-associated protein [Larsenimonas suaedae]MDR5895468.1 nucleoid-associated protein [Larsenimonas suaedae]